MRKVFAGPKWKVDKSVIQSESSQCAEMDRRLCTTNEYLEGRLEIGKFVYISLK